MADRSLAAELRARPPALHGQGELWGLAWAALRFLEATVRPGMATLETGAGASTIVFAAGGAEHEAITPSAGEADRIRGECERRGISLEGVRFRIGSSHEVLPAWEARPLDLALVDGAHGFPYPILDWWYLAPHLKTGGLMILDDAYMPPVACVLDHCRRSPAWRVEDAISYRTAVVRKLADETPEFEYAGGRYGGAVSFRYLPAHRRAVATLRHRLLDSPVGARAVRAGRRIQAAAASARRRAFARGRCG